jgi:hypothetical protein
MSRQTAAVLPLALALLCILSISAQAQDYPSWIRYSDSGDNPLIVQMIHESDLSTALQITSAIGQREDARIQEIILAVGERSDPRPLWERELILRALLASVFPGSLTDSELEDRLRMNREGLDFLVAGLPGFTLSLKREVVRLLGFLHPPGYLSALMAEGRRLADLLTLQRGDLNGEQAGLTLTYLETLERIADPEFAEIVLLILERSRHLEVAQAARSVSRLLLLKE